jgi:biopolymer transport protein ExbD
MGLRRTDDPVAMSEINVTPLVDVMLVLLVVFIVTAPLLLQAVKVDLPQTAAVPPAAETRVLQVAVDAIGAVYVDSQPTELAALESALQATADIGALDVQLHADAGVAYGRVAQVMAALQRAGVARLSFVTVAAGAGDRPAADPGR